MKPWGEPKTTNPKAGAPASILIRKYDDVSSTPFAVEVLDEQNIIIEGTNSIIWYEVKVIADGYASKYSLPCPPTPDRPDWEPDPNTFPHHPQCPIYCNHPNHWQDITPRGQQIYQEARPSEQIPPRDIWGGFQMWNIIASEIRPNETYHQYTQRIQNAFRAEYSQRERLSVLDVRSSDPPTLKKITFSR